MPMWTSDLDAIYVINLEKRSERLAEVTEELAKYNIPFERVEGIELKEGARGLMITLIGLFTDCVQKEFEKVLVLEDDVKLLEDPNEVMPLALAQLPHDFHLLYLGAYLIQPFRKKYSDNLYLLNAALTTHAIIYSKKAMEIILPQLIKMAEIKFHMMPVDMMLNTKVVKLYNSYITNPLLATQVSGHSDIQNKEIDYFKYIETSYKKHSK